MMQPSSAPHEPADPVQPVLQVDARRLLEEENAALRAAVARLEEQLASLERRKEYNGRDERLRASEERLRVALTAGGMGTWTLDLRTNVASLDARGREVLGLPPADESISLEHFYASVHPDDLPEVGEAERRLREEGVRFESEFRILRDGGEVRWIASEGSVVRDDTGRAVLSTGVCRDVTNQRLAEDALRESERSFRLLADSMPQLVWSARPDGTVEYYNGRVEAFRGFRYAEEVGWEWEGPLHPDDHQRTADAWEHSVRTGDVYQIEHRTQMADGQYRWHLSRAVPVRDDEGRVLRWFGTATDIHEHKLAEDTLRRNERLFRAAIDHFPGAFTIYDAERRLLYVNSNVLEMTGLPEGAFTGRRDEEVLPSSLTDCYLPALRSVYASGNPERLEYTLPPEHGGTTQIVTFVPVHDEAGAIQQVLGFRIDITERKQAEIALREAKEDAETANRMKSVFLANMSHEIRTPLTGILGFANLLSRISDGRARGYADRIERSGKRLTETLNAVLTLARLEAGRHEMVLEPLSLAAEAAEVADMYRADAVAKGLQLVVHVSPVARQATATLDRGAFTSILQNLVSNAVKFTDRGAVAIFVDVEAPLGPDDTGISGNAPAPNIVATVEDTGIGIGDEFMPRLFEPFAQESSGISRTHEGTGLGLSIARQLTEHMGGVIRAHSTRGRGSRFIVSFPADAHTVSVAPSSEQGRMAASGGAGKILVVEDQEDTRVLMDVLLQEVGCVTLASHANDALALAQMESDAGAPFDLVLVDVNLGDGPNGVDLLKALRAIPAYRTVPIAVITAYALPGDAERYLKQGFDVYVRKPFSADELLDVATRMLHSQRLVAQRPPVAQ